MTPDTIQAALTREEWAREMRNDMLPGVPWRFLTWFEMQHGATAYPSPHALAALALHEQPFGFTRGDVRFLSFLGPCDDAPDYVERHWDEKDIARLNSIIARIAALLPPEA